MKGNQKVIAALNNALAEELTAISQYVVHAEMYDNWGYEKLHARFEKVARDEMKHAGMLISRIIFLEGRPIVSELRKFHIGEEPKGMIGNDLTNELGAVKLYNDLAAVAIDAGDNTTRELVESILKDEEGHVDLEEAQLDQITQMGIQTYLAEQIRE